MIFLDSSFLISFYCEDEENHRRAVELFGGIAETMVLTDHILGEVVTLIKKRYGVEKARKAGAVVADAKQVELVFSDAVLTGEALDAAGKFPNLSFCDALSFAVMRKRRIRKIYSFDSDFDRLPGILRVC